jgi:hypothetical protein
MRRNSHAARKASRRFPESCISAPNGYANCDHYRISGGGFCFKLSRLAGIAVFPITLHEIRAIFKLGFIEAFFILAAKSII